jgi:hypothetical protein
MAQIFTNNAISTLASPLGLSDTAMSIAPGTGSRWPVIAAPDFAFTTLEDAAGNIEIVKITAHTSGSTTFTIERAQQGTAARAYSIGDLVELRLTRAEMTAWEADIDDLEATRSRHAGQVYTGAHDFGAASGVTLPAATSIGNVSAAEISHIDGLTSNAQAQIDNITGPLLAAKADIAGETYTGTHDFTGATLIAPGKADVAGETYSGTHDFTGATLRAQTKAFGSSGTEVATVDYVNNAALTTVLPGQTGNAGKVLTTNGSVTSWQEIPPPNQLPILALGII